MVEVKDLQKSIGNQEVLKGVTLTLKDHERHTLIGESGEGKSILLKTIIGLIEPDGGRIYMDGEDITDFTPKECNERVRTKMSMVFQQGALWDSMTVSENIDLALNIRKHLTEGERRDLVEQSLAMVGLEGAGAKFPGELSGGMMKRAAIARALAARPTYLLYDEPTTGLDPVLSNMVIDLITRLNDELNVTAFIVSHDVERLADFSDTVSLLRGGRIETTCPAGSVWESDNRALSNFLRGVE
jgi:phospholipid/cholesterol/gamma-HCH transport system ATP-binding protein